MLCFVTIIKGEHPTHLLPCLFIKGFMRLSTGPRDLIVTILAQKQSYRRVGDRARSAEMSPSRGQTIPDSPAGSIRRAR